MHERVWEGVEMKLLIYNSISAQLNLIATATSQKTLSNLEYTRKQKNFSEKQGEMPPSISPRGGVWQASLNPSCSSIFFFLYNYNRYNALRFSTPCAQHDSSVYMKTLPWQLQECMMTLLLIPPKLWSWCHHALLQYCR